MGFVCVIFLTFVACSMIVGISSESLDSTQFENGKIVFGALNGTGQYRLSEHLDSYADSALFGIDFYVEIAPAFVSALMKVPWDLIARLKDVNFDVKQIVKDWEFYAKGEVPILTSFTIGVLVALVAPVIGLLLVICRCCGRCGAKYYQEEARRQFVTDTLMPAASVACAVVVCGMIIVFAAGVLVISSERLHNSLPRFETASEKAIDDFVLFQDKVLEELDILSNEKFGVVSDVLSAELENLPDRVGSTFLDAGRPSVQNLTRNLVMLDENLVSLNRRINETETISAQMTLSGGAIAQLVAQVKANLTNLQTACSGSPDCGHMVSPDDVDPVFDFSQTPDMKAKTISLNPIKSLDLVDMASSAMNTFDGIPNDVNATSYEKLLEIRDPLNELKDPIQAALNTTVKVMLIEFFERLNLNATQLKKDIKTSISTCSQNAGYELYILGFLVSQPLLAFLLSVLGMIIGFAGTKCRHAGSRRNKMSHLGSKLNWSSSAIIFSSIFFVMLFGATLFLFGSNLTLACKPVKDESVFEEFLDEPLYWNDKYIMGELVYNDSSIPLKLGDVFKECKANKGLFAALQMNNSFTIRDFVNYNMNLSGFESVFAAANDTVKGTTLIDDSARQKLVDVVSSSPTIHPALLMQNIKTGLTNLDLTKIADGLEMAANKMVDQAYKVPYLEMVSRLRQMNMDTLPNLENSVAALDAKIQDIATGTNDILALTTAVIDNLDKIHDFMQNSGAEILTETMKEYVSRMVGFGDQYIDFVQNSLFESVGQCEVVHQIYRFLSETVCGNFLNGLNGYWLSLNVIGVFCIIMLVLNFKVANYYRTVCDPYPFMEWDLTNTFNPSLKYEVKSDCESDLCSLRASISVSTIPDYCFQDMGEKYKAELSQNDCNNNNATIGVMDIALHAALPSRRSSLTSMISWMYTSCILPRLALCSRPRFCQKKAITKNAKADLTTGDVFSMFGDDVLSKPHDVLSKPQSSWWTTMFGNACKSKPIKEAPELTKGDVFSNFGDEVKKPSIWMRFSAAMSRIQKMCRRQKVEGTTDIECNPRIPTSLPFYVNNEVVRAPYIIGIDVFPQCMIDEIASAGTYPGFYEVDCLPVVPSSSTDSIDNPPCVFLAGVEVHMSFADLDDIEEGDLDDEDSGQDGMDLEHSQADIFASTSSLSVVDSCV